MKRAAPALEPTPAAALLIALATGLLHLLLTLGLATAIGATLAVYALAALLAYGACFALFAPRLGSAPALRLGFVRPTWRSALACALLLASVLWISELDNWVKALFPLPAALREALHATQPVPGAGERLRECIELVLVDVAVFPLVYGVFYRGFLQPALVARLGALRGVLLGAALEASSALVDPLYLWDWPVVAARAALLGTLRHCSGSLVPALALDALMGAVTTAAHYRLFGIAGFDELEVGHTPATWLAAAALPTALGLWLCRRLLLERRAAEP